MPKSQSRKFSHCALCEAPAPLSREHIWTKALAKRVDPTMPAYRQGPDGQHVANGYLVLRETAWCFCRACNKSFDRNVNRCAEPLAKLIKGKTNRIPGELRAEVLRFFQRIGLIYDLETQRADGVFITESADDTRNNSRFRTDPGILTQAERTAFHQGHPLERVAVHFARNTVVTGATMEMQFRRLYEIDQTTGQRKPSHRFFAIMKRLAIAVDIGVISDPLPPAFVALTDGPETISLFERPVFDNQSYALAVHSNPWEQQAAFRALTDSPAQLQAEARERIRKGRQLHRAGGGRR